MRNITKIVKTELTTDEAKILEIIKSQKCNKDEMAIYINKSKATVDRIIKRLIEMKLIKRIGSNKTGYWSLL